MAIWDHSSWLVDGCFRILPPPFSASLSLICLQLLLMILGSEDLGGHLQGYHGNLSVTCSCDGTHTICWDITIESEFLYIFRLHARFFPSFHCPQNAFHCQACKALNQGIGESILGLYYIRMWQSCLGMLTDVWHMGLRHVGICMQVSS